jgi:hypothetical protein
MTVDIRNLGSGWPAASKIGVSSGGFVGICREQICGKAK